MQSSAISGAVYATHGLMHGCVIVKPRAETVVPAGLPRFAFDLAAQWCAGRGKGARGGFEPGTVEPSGSLLNRVEASTTA
jgi:hypothetical protein